MQQLTPEQQKQKDDYEKLMATIGKNMMTVLKKFPDANDLKQTALPQTEPSQYNEYLQSKLAGHVVDNNQFDAVFHLVAFERKRQRECVELAVTENKYVARGNAFELLVQVCADIEAGKLHNSHAIFNSLVRTNIFSRIWTMDENLMELTSVFLSTHGEEEQMKVFQKRLDQVKEMIKPNLKLFISERHMTNILVDWAFENLMKKGYFKERKVLKMNTSKGENNE